MQGASHVRLKDECISDIAIVGMLAFKIEQMHGAARIRKNNLIVCTLSIYQNVKFQKEG